MILRPIARAVEQPAAHLPQAQLRDVIEPGGPVGRVDRHGQQLGFKRLELEARDVQERFQAHVPLQGGGAIFFEQGPQARETVSGPMARRGAQVLEPSVREVRRRQPAEEPGAPLEDPDAERGEHRAIVALALIQQAQTRIVAQPLEQEEFEEQHRLSTRFAAERAPSSVRSSEK